MKSSKSCRRPLVAEDDDRLSLERLRDELSGLPEPYPGITPLDLTAQQLFNLVRLSWDLFSGFMAGHWSYLRDKSNLQRLLVRAQGQMLMPGKLTASEFMEIVRADAELSGLFDTLWTAWLGATTTESLSARFRPTFCPAGPESTNQSRWKMTLTEVQTYEKFKSFPADCNKWRWDKFSMPQLDLFLGLPGISESWRARAEAEARSRSETQDGVPMVWVEMRVPLHALADLQQLIDRLDQEPLNEPEDLGPG